jgi:hypothetical protein
VAAWKAFMRLFDVNSEGLTGAVALEATAGMVLESQGDRGRYLLVTAAEEGLEMAGSVLLLYVRGHAPAGPATRA